MSDDLGRGEPADRFVSHPGKDSGRRLRKRFYTNADVVSHDDGFALTLDGRVVKTPARAGLAVPTAELATAIAGEWLAQGEEIDPETMPLTKMANTAIDRVAGVREHVVGEIAAFGGSDLLCYRADSPGELVARQAAAWDPWLRWLTRTYGAKLVVTTGVMFQPQSEDALSALRARVALSTDFQLAGLHEAVSLSGSLVLGLALADDQISAAQVYDLAHIDEMWQAEKWGADDEAQDRLRKRSQALAAAGWFLKCLRDATSAQ